MRILRKLSTSNWCLALFGPNFRHNERNRTNVSGTIAFRFLLDMICRCTDTSQDFIHRLLTMDMENSVAVSRSFPDGGLFVRQPVQVRVLLAQRKA